MCNHDTAPDGYLPYEPQMHLQSIGPEIWIVDGPVLKWGYAGVKLPFPTRMTVIRLGDGSIWVHSPVTPNRELIKAVSDLGPIRHLVSPNCLHHVFLAPWAECFPDARIWASPGARKRSEVSFSDDLSDTPPPYWCDVIDQRIARGSFAVEEVVFFHKPSATLILADLIENFEMNRVPSRFVRALIKIGRVHMASTPLDFRLSFLGRQGSLRPVVEWMLGCEPRQIVIAHGKWITKDAMAILKKAFGWVLR